MGNIFGAPLAMEGLLAFFAESTFIALWLFGRNRLPPLAHTLSICVVGLATIVSAFFILTANAWMQHPVGYRIVRGKAELTDFWAVLRNSTLWAEFSHTVLAALLVMTVVAAIFVPVMLAYQGWSYWVFRQRLTRPVPSPPAPEPPPATATSEPSAGARRHRR